MKSYFLPVTKIALVLVYLVIIAGAMVRMTGSGMGCPDWPKCFGYYIPPTNEAELLFTPNKTYNKGMVIIKDETLFVAKSTFTTTQNYNKENWIQYTKHDYAVFNPFHTWVEYINRLFGALAGLACVASFALAFWHWKANKKLLLFSFAICVLMGFQAWLGKTVVDSVLSPVKITTHMLVAFLIVALQLYLIFYFTRLKNNLTLKVNSTFNKVMLFALTLTIIQVVLGTGVREFIDHISKTNLPKEFWLNEPTVLFYIHRSFSILVILTTAFLVYKNYTLNLKYGKIKAILLIILLEILSGIAMANFAFPFGTQTIHLVLSALLFGFQFYLLLEIYFNNKRELV